MWKIPSFFETFCYILPFFFRLRELKKKQISTLFQENENESVDSPSQESDDSSSETVPCTSVQTSHPRPPRRKRNASDSMDLPNAVLQSVNEHFKRPPVKEDRFDIFGKNVAMILRELPKQQRLLAEKIINDTLFQAEMGTLTLPPHAASTVYFPSYQAQQTHGIPTPSAPTQQPQQFFHEVSTPSPSTSLPQSQPVHQYSTEQTLVQLSIPNRVPGHLYLALLMVNKHIKILTLK
nr:unnamed protein product [Callosobruchus analis]